MPSSAVKFDFDTEYQEKIAALALRDTQFMNQARGLLEPGYFERDIDAAIVSIASDYFDRYGKAPDRRSAAHLMTQAVRDKKIRSDMVDDLKNSFKEYLTMDITDRDSVVDEVDTFAREMAMEQAILKSSDLLDKRDFAAIKAEIDKASLVGARTTTKSIDYWNDIDTRTQYRKDLIAGKIKREGITTGIPDLDKLLYHHGWGRKELSVLMGAAKAGKSMGLGDLAKNASLAGFNTLYVSCEVSAQIIADRTDANVADILMEKVGTKPFEIETQVKKLQAKAGRFIIYEFASGTLKVSGLRRLIEEERKKGNDFDLIVVDYADILCPERRVDNQVDNMRQIYLDLRAISFEYNAALLTATQTNRDGAKAMTAKATDVAEDYNKVRTADVLISINSTEEERDAGEARLFLAAVRNSKDGYTVRIKQDRSRMQFIKGVIGIE